MATKYPKVVRALSETPWVILPSTLETIAELVAFRAQGNELTPEEIQARIGSGPAQKSAIVNGSIGVLPLYGVLFPRASLFTQMSGGTSVQQWAADFQAMVDDSAVSAILIDVHSPGGSTFLLPETAARIRAARGQKPIVAVANALCASGAYYLASQADEVIASPSALLGSIGAYMLHEDWSKFNEALGIDPTHIFAGKFKTEGNDAEPLSDEARSHFQEIVDDVYGQFVSDVAKGRGVRVAEVRNGFGQGRVLPASLAVEFGLADRVDTLEGTLARLAKGAITPTKARAETATTAAEIEEPGAGDSEQFDEQHTELLASVGSWAADTRADMHALPLQRSLSALALDPTEEAQ